MREEDRQRILERRRRERARQRKRKAMMMRAAVAGGLVLILILAITAVALGVRKGKQDKAQEKARQEQALKEEEEKQKQLQQAVKQGKITFFIARRGYRAVGMCSAAKCYSTFSCWDTAVFEDFYIEPVFRGKGIARKLAKAAQTWCAENGMSSLTVCCAPCDENMYQSLGFDVRLGTTFAHLE